MEVVRSLANQVNGVQLDIMSDASTALESWLLHAEANSGSINRDVAILPLPVPRNPALSANSIYDARPISFTIDLGMVAESIILTGVTNDADYLIVPNTKLYPVQTGATKGYPTMWQLKEIVRCGWTYFTSHVDFDTKKYSVGGGIRLNVIEDIEDHHLTVYSYFAAIQAFSWQRNGGEERYEWKMTFAVTGWAGHNGGTQLIT